MRPPAAAGPSSVVGLGLGWLVSGREQRAAAAVLLHPALVVTSAAADACACLLSPPLAASSAVRRGLRFLGFLAASPKPLTCGVESMAIGNQ